MRFESKITVEQCEHLVDKFRDYFDEVHADLPNNFDDAEYVLELLEDSLQDVDMVSHFLEDELGQGFVMGFLACQQAILDLDEDYAEEG